MKELLLKLKDGSYSYTNSDMDSVPAYTEVIEIPKGAHSFRENLRFYNEDGSKFYSSGNYWENSITSNTIKTIWVRPSRPEELPFLDSLNDQYAEIEQVRQQVNSLPEFKHDFVNHPKHYCDHPSGIECIEITRHHDFAIGNAIKYLWRAGLKDSDNEIQDLKKAVWYIQDKIAQLENK